jgi:hypothetical protein
VSLFEAASLTESLLVAKGAAAPSWTTGAYPTSERAPRRTKQPDLRPRVTLRLDEEQHRRVRIAAVHLRKRAQLVMVAALDHYLEHVVPTLLVETCRCLEGGTYPTPACAEICPALKPVAAHE